MLDFCRVGLVRSADMTKILTRDPVKLFRANR